MTNSLSPSLAEWLEPVAKALRLANICGGSSVKVSAVIDAATGPIGPAYIAQATAALQTLTPLIEAKDAEIAAWRSAVNDFADADPAGANWIKHRTALAQGEKG